MLTTTPGRGAACALGLLLFGCAQGVSGGSEDYSGGKCDILGQDGDLAEICEFRMHDLSHPSAFLRDAVRWSCADVEGVNSINRDDRGTEYCEYYAYLVPEAMNFGAQRPVGLFGKITATSRQVPLSFQEVFGFPLSENEEVLFELEDHPDRVVGQCVFTAWNGDRALDACGATSCDYKLDVDGELVTSGPGIDLHPEMLATKDPLNHLDAAWALARDCAVARDGAAEDIFRQSCLSLEDKWHSADRFYHYSKSNAALCAAASSLAGCGCGGGGEATADVLVPVDGATLGGWNLPELLPVGCQANADASVVTCRLRARDVLANDHDVKHACRSIYARDVVVYLPLSESTCPGNDVMSCGVWNL
jgi:hypothetical protein